MNIHFILHAPFEKLGAIETWAIQNNHFLQGTHTYQGEVLPSTDTFELLIVMGGPQNAIEVDKYPYLQDEVNFIKTCIAQNKKILGICLGAQLIGQALGAKTQKSQHKEIGMYPVEVLDAGMRDPVFKQFPKFFDVMHWHNDMPSIPEKAELLAKSEGCAHQAFRYKDRVYGLQFHLELTKALVNQMITHCPEDLMPGKYIRSKDELLGADFGSNHEKLYSLLDYLASLSRKLNLG